MKLWLLRPVDGLEDDRKTNPWEPWFDKCFGFVVRAESEHAAREIAQSGGADEVRQGYPARGTRPVWTDPLLATCVELTTEGEAGVVIEDVHAA